MTVKSEVVFKNIILLKSLAKKHIEIKIIIYFSVGKHSEFNRISNGTNRSSSSVEVVSTSAVVM